MAVTAADCAALHPLAVPHAGMDGGASHPVIQENHIEIIDGLAKKGVGLGFAHFAVEVPAGKSGEAFQRWIGGYYEHEWSCNPIWKPEFKEFPKHPIANGGAEFFRSLPDLAQGFNVLLIVDVIPIPQLVQRLCFLQTWN